MLVLLSLLLSSQSFAKDKDKFWFSNKVEVGYNKIFISNQVRFDRDEFTKNSLAAGFRFKVSNTTSFKTFYLLENSLKEDWHAHHFLCGQLELKL